LVYNLFISGMWERARDVCHSLCSECSVLDKSDVNIMKTLFPLMRFYSAPHNIRYNDIVLTN